MGKKFLVALLALLALMMALPMTGAFAEGTREAVAIPEGDWNVPYPELVTITTIKPYIWR